VKWKLIEVGKKLTENEEADREWLNRDKELKTLT